MNWVLIYIISGVLLLFAFIYGSICQTQVQETFSRFSTEEANSGVCGAELAYKLLAKAGINNVSVVKTNGKLTDCYDSKRKVIKLSKEVYYSTSISALGVCAHEVGHAIQDKKKNKLFLLRRSLAPVLSFVTKAFIPLMLIGSIFSFTYYIPVFGYYMILASLIFYGATLIFEMITLPLEFDASNKALKILEETNTLNSYEIEKAAQVLRAAAKTYIASLATTLLYFLRFLSLATILEKNR